MSKQVPSITTQEWEHIEDLAWVVNDSGNADEDAIYELVEDIVNRASRREKEAKSDE